MDASEQLQNRKQRRYPALWLLYTLAVAAVIFWFSAQSGDDSGEISYGMAERIEPMLGLDTNIWYYLYCLNMLLRKLAHFGIFFALGVGLYGTLDCQDRLPPAPAAAAIGILYSISDELHQSFVPGRVAKVLDVAIDTAGVVAGIAAAALLLRRLRRRQARRDAAPACGR